MDRMEFGRTGRRVFPVGFGGIPIQRLGPDRFYGPRTSGEVDRARQCEDCGRCEQRCPFDLPVRALLRELTGWYDEKMALHKGGRSE